MIGAVVRCAARRRRACASLFLTGIWPPDVGGPATHGPDFARFLVARGHDVRVVTMADGEPTERPVPVEVVSRGLPFPSATQVALAWLRRAAGAADVIYATATYAAAAAAATRRAEAARREARLRPGLRARAALRRLRRHARGVPERARKAGARAARRLAHASRSGRASTIVVPSAYLAEIARGWGLEHDRIVVLTNPAPAARDVEPEQLEPSTFVFVGRLTRQKALGDRDRRGRAACPTRSSSLVGDGPERARLERTRRRPRARPGARSSARCRATRRLRIVAGAEAGAPLERLGEPAARGRRGAGGRAPVVATAVGGVPEVVHDGENGLLVPPGDPDAARGRDRPHARGAGAARAARRGGEASVAALSGESDLQPARADPRGGRDDDRRPRVLFVGRNALHAPAPGVAREEVGRGRAAARLPRARCATGDSRSSDRPLPARAAGAAAPLDGLLFYLRLPSSSGARSAASARRDRRDRPVLGRGAARAPALRAGGVPRDRRGARRLADLHAPVRLAGRGGLLAASPTDSRPAVRRADASGRSRASPRSSSRRCAACRRPRRSRLHRPLRLHRAAVVPLPERPTAVFVGMLEPYKNVDGLADAWRLVAVRLPEARLVIVGKGSRSVRRSRSSWRTFPAGRAPRVARPGGRLGERSTTRRCSCCRPGRKASAGS